jgi:SARP family transcriptional regulator, regulator of embCAB operon
VQGASDAARVQLCGTFVVELAGRRVNQALPGRQGRLLFAYLTLSRLQPVTRDVLVDAL